MKPFVDAHQINYIVGAGNQDLFQQFNGVGIPYTLVLDPSQQIVKIYRGPTDSRITRGGLKPNGAGTDPGALPLNHG